VTSTDVPSNKSDKDNIDKPTTKCCAFDNNQWRDTREWITTLDRGPKVPREDIFEEHRLSHRKRDTNSKSYCLCLTCVRSFYIGIDSYNLKLSMILFELYAN